MLFHLTDFLKSTHKRVHQNIERKKKRKKFIDVRCPDTGSQQKMLKSQITQYLITYETYTIQEQLEKAREAIRDVKTPSDHQHVNGSTKKR